MFEELSFGKVLRLSARVWWGTLAQQAAVVGCYAALLVAAIGGLGLMKVSVIFALIGVLAGIVFFVFFGAMPYLLAALMAPRAVQLMRGEQDEPAASAPWHLLPSILWSSFALSWLISFMSQFFLVPGILALSALWSWPLVAACEPGAAGMARAQELVKGRQGKVMTWFMVLMLCMLVPVVVMLILGAYALDSVIKFQANLPVVLALFGASALIMAACIVLQSSFWAAIYGVLRHDEQRGELDTLLHTFE
jgi:hypothetical protein